MSINDDLKGSLSRLTEISETNADANSEERSKRLADITKIEEKIRYKTTTVYLKKEQVKLIEEYIKKFKKGKSEFVRDLLDYALLDVEKVEEYNERKY